MSVDYRDLGFWSPSFAGVIGYKGLTRSDKDVLGVLVRYGQAHPTTGEVRSVVTAGRIATDTALAVRSVRAGFARLRDAGFIAVAGTTRDLNGWKLKQDHRVWSVNMNTIAMVIRGEGGDQNAPLPNGEGDQRSPLGGSMITPTPDQRSPLSFNIDHTQILDSKAPASPAPNLFGDALSKLGQAPEDDQPAEPATTGINAKPEAGHTPEEFEKLTTYTRRTVHDAYTGAVGYAYDLGGPGVPKLTALIVGVARARQEPFETVLTRCLDGFFADDFWKAKRYPMNALIRQAPKWADPPTAKDAAAVVVDKDKLEARIGTLKGKLMAARSDLKLAEAHRDQDRAGRINAAIAKISADIAATELRLAGG